MNPLASKRVVAFLIDLLVYVVMWVFFYFNFHLGDYISWILASSYILLKDGFINGQSLGKLVLKLQVVDTVNKQPISIRASVERNAILILPNFFRFIPFLGALLLILVFIWETYLIYNYPNGCRWGDQFAKTEVVPL